MKIFFEYFWSIKFVRNVVFLASGSLFAQLITIFFTPLVIKIYGANTFGTLSVFMAVVTLLSPLITFGYSAAVNLPRADSNSIHIVSVSFILAFCFSLISSVLIFLYESEISDYLNLNDLNYLFILMPLVFFIYAALEILQQWAIRKKLFHAFGKIPLLSSLIANLLKVISGCFFISSQALICATVLGSLLQPLFFIFFLIKNKAIPFNKKSIKISSIKRICKNYREFPLYRFPHLSILVLSQNLPVLFIASYSGVKVAGFYSLAKLATSMPSGFLGKSVSDVFYQRINEASRNKEDLSFMLLKPTMFLFKLSLLPLFLFLPLAPYIFETILGEEWLSAGVCAQWLSIYYFFNLIRKPSQAAVPVLRLQKNIMFFEFFGMVIQLSALLVGLHIYLNTYLAVALYSIAGAFTHLFITVWVIKKSRRSVL